MGVGRLVRSLILRSWEKSPAVHPWQFFKELEDSLNLIEDIDQISMNFLGKIKEMIPVSTLILAIYDPDRGKFRVQDSFGVDDAVLPGFSFSRKDSLVKWLKINKTYFYSRELPGVLAYLTPGEQDILRSAGIDLCLPLISMNRLIGIILMGPKASGEPFSKEELAFLASITPQIGIALENALLYKEQRERFRRMLRADRLATIGELAAGAAHEIRNPLTTVHSSLQYLESSIHDEKARSLLDRALEETNRINGILTGLLSFSRPTEIKREKGNLLTILEECLELVSFQAHQQKIAIVRDFPPAPAYFNGDKAQIKQLLLNLFLNSIQAMRGGGELRVEVDVKDDRRVMVVISDTGEGIPEENLDKVFDPFFTTKKGGTGLGLSICYGIVTSHGGDIQIRSQVSQGTTALVSIPVFS